MKVTASDPQPVHIPARARHTFTVDTTYDGPCTVEFNTDASPKSPSNDPEANGTSEKLYVSNLPSISGAGDCTDACSFRNLYQYLDDCWAQAKSPSLPQLLLFLDSAEVSLALPGPAWIAQPVSYAMGVVIGKWFGGYVLGYKDSYPEYWDESKETKKNR